LSIKRVKSVLNKDPPVTSGKLDNMGSKQESEERKKKYLERQRVMEVQSTANITYTPSVFPLNETKYFDQVPTKITGYLFLGTHNITKNKTLLKGHYGISHIVNCSKKENLYPEHFEYLNPQIPNKDDEYSLIDLLPSFFEFVAVAGKLQGRILLISEDDDGFGVALVLGFLMDNFKLSFFESFQHLQCKRYVINIDVRYIRVLLSWEKANQKETYRQKYACLCRANKWILLVPFDKTEYENPLICDCQIGDFSSCPYHGCGKFCRELTWSLEEKDFQYARLISSGLSWGYTTKSSVQGIPHPACEEYYPLQGLTVPDKIQDKSIWTIFRCRKCHFICYAENKNSQTIAIVTNLLYK